MNRIFITDEKGKDLLLFDEETELYNEEDIYCEETAEYFNDNDEISSAEEGFMRGYLAA